MANGAITKSPTRTVCDPATDRLDHPHELVADPLWLVRRVDAAVRPEIRAADAARHNAYDGIGRPGNRRIVDLLEADVAGAVDEGGVHACSQEMTTDGRTPTLARTHFGKIGRRPPRGGLVGPPAGPLWVGFEVRRCAPRTSTNECPSSLVEVRAKRASNQPTRGPRWVGFEARALGALTPQPTSDRHRWLRCERSEPRNQPSSDGTRWLRCERSEPRNQPTGGRRWVVGLVVT